MGASAVQAALVALAGRAKKPAKVSGMKKRLKKVQKELAKQNLAKTAYAAKQFGRQGSILFDGAPRFNEFVLETSEDPYAINSRILGHKIVGGLPLKKFYPELGNASLWCCTELTTRTAIDTAVGVVSESENSIRADQGESFDEDGVSEVLP